MINRIVKLTFAKEKSEHFNEFYTSITDKIQSCPGCRSVKVLRDINTPEIFFSYSIWENEDKLNLYRDSEFFRGTWSTIKPWFSEKAEAWSTKSAN
jgi:heme-degrading monooxygenase HmoA